MHTEGIPKNDFTIPDVVDDPLNHFLTEELFCMRDRRNFQGIQAIE